MDNAKSNPLSPVPKSSIVGGYRIQRCSGLRGSVPLSVPLHADKHTEKIVHETRPYPLNLNESGEERTLTQMETLGEAFDVLKDVVKDTYRDVQKIHGDISPNTIFRNKHGQGVLVDWDHNNWMREILRTYREILRSNKAA
ncbi:hypothetical protein CVT25_011291 [Psilocybe cyanescens]|uniref:Uncharacterized protein n=1 Tax=Psilocybe cyanescens TaxID=93625 RepID=A0A409XCA9_PSICY|nr:hypothetical protein CVT25_011291 [Psilocybe cyanescens]